MPRPLHVLVLGPFFNIAPWAFLLRTSQGHSNARLQIEGVLSRAELILPHNAVPRLQSGYTLCTAVVDNVSPTLDGKATNRVSTPCRPVGHDKRLNELRECGGTLCSPQTAVRANDLPPHQLVTAGGRKACGIRVHTEFLEQLCPD